MKERRTSIEYNPQTDTAAVEEYLQKVSYTDARVSGELLGIDNEVPSMLSESEHNTLFRFIEVLRSLRNIHALYAVHCFNTDYFVRYYEFSPPVAFVRRDLTIDRNVSDEIVINAFMKNIYSSASSLIEAIDLLLVNYCGRAAKENCVNKEHDTSLSYQMLQKLRDFTQHGHLAVSVLAGVHCFYDINRLSRELHFDWKKYLNEIFRNFSGHFLPVTILLADMEVSVFRIYKRFYEYAVPLFRDEAANVKSLLEKRPDLVRVSKDNSHRYVIFAMLDDQDVRIFDADIDVSPIDSLANEAEAKLQLAIAARDSLFAEYVSYIDKDAVFDIEKHNESIRRSIENYDRYRIDR